MAEKIEVTAEDVQTLAFRLSHFIDTLTQGERKAFEIVEWYLAMNALEEEHEVSGYIAQDAGAREGLWRSLTTALLAQQESQAS